MNTRIKTLITLLLSAAGVVHAQEVSQFPLTVSPGVPGNMVLTPSVEFPTINSKANLGNFAAGTTYTGYFDPFKCYKYQYDAVESLRHFYPFRIPSTTVPAVCSAAALEWSGNWLNWATTQTIDPFRKALTGGLRVRDTPTETWLEKARHDGQGGLGYFPNAATTGLATISGALPNSTWTTVTTRIVGGGSELYFTSTRVCAAVDVIGGTLPTNSATQQVVAYDPATHVLNAVNSNAPVVNTDCDATAAVNNQPQTNANRIYRVSVRVKVCVAGMPESNCVQYASGLKPEGLIQKYSNKIRFSVFGYLLDNGAFRDGGVLRANQKFVGPTYLNKLTRNWEPNTYREWDDNGVFIDNPNPADALATQTLVNGGTVTHPIRYSGVISYINRFAQLTGTDAKNYDPVSELYYTATRYLRALAPVSTYSNLNVRYTNAAGVATTAGVDRFNLTDGFPVITRWEDPYEYRCQSSAILGIGDVYTHKDKNLKGNTASTTNEPAMPAAVAADPIINDVVWWTQRAYALEGVAFNPVLNSGLNNSPYMVGLAYYAHTQDLRTQPEMSGLQRVSTHWVDVREVQRIEPRVRNQYWMAAKYGGFDVPGALTEDPSDDYNSLTNTTPLANTLWTSGETLTSNSADWPNETFQRTSNYYVADRPATMVSSLTSAFANIAAERTGSGSALAANSTRLDTETRTFQAQFLSGSWQGQLTMNDFDLASGTIDPEPIWRAGERMPIWTARNILVNAGGSAVAFRYTNLTVAQKAAIDALNTTLSPPSPGPAITGTDIVNYIRGQQTKEEGTANGTLRVRPTEEHWSPILGDIVNSTPTYVGAPNRALWAKNPGTWSGKDTYEAFATAQAGRRQVVWVGGNDGMLHAFDASETGGAEIYAFIPNTAIINGLVNVADPDYQHRYFVDGDMAIADVYTGGAWRTILVATMGRGIPGVFALDVTNPNLPVFLWERNQTDIPALGHNIGRPVIAQIADGVWRVIFGNGAGSVGGRAKLISLDVMSGASTVFDTDMTTSNDLTAPVLWDQDLDGLFETAYAGDLNGNLWKISDLTSSGSAELMFQATDGTDPQPITAAPVVGKDPTTGATWIWFGTGRFLEESDLADTQIQSWYGLKDDFSGTTINRSQLVERTIIRDTADDVTVGGDVLELRRLEVAEDGDMAGMRGWYIDLTTTINPEPGERMVVPNLIVGQSLVGTTRTPVPGDACDPGFTSWFMAINPFTGARLNQNFWDINRDGNPSSGDNTATGLIQSGIRTPRGANTPIAVGNLVCTTLDDGSTICLRVRGSNADARRGSWREITN